MSEEAPSQVIDCSELSAIDIARRLATFNEDSIVELTSVRNGMQAFGAGLTGGAVGKLSADLGDFVYLLGDAGGLEIDGVVGHGCGHSMLAGRLVIRKSAGDYLGVYAQGGFIAAISSVGDRCAFGMRGADIFVRSTAGDEEGAMMQDGTLVLGNGAGENLGVGMTGGMIYMRGDAESIAPNLRAVRIKDPDAMRLSLLLARAGIKSDGKDFKAFRPKSS